MASHRNYSIDKSAIKALVTIYGPREAARKAGLPVGTVLSWARTHKWKKALVVPKGVNPPGAPNAANKDAGDLIKEALEGHRTESALNLAQYTEKASKKAVQNADPLSISHKVRDVAQIFKTLFPPETESELIEGAILIGTAKVTDNPEEIMGAVQEIQDVRQELPDQGPESH